MKIQTVQINEIRGNKDNPRIVNKDKYNKLKKSIQDFPQMLNLRPIIVNDDNVILGGNMRYKALVELGYKEVPVIKAKDLTEKQAQEFIIKDNLSYGDWDFDILANEWDRVELEQWGFDVWQNEDDIIAHEAEEDDYYIEPDDIKVDVVLGDLIEIGEHRLLCGDSTDVILVKKVLDNKKADLITDPPYGINANKQTLGTGKKQFYRGQNWDNEKPNFFEVIDFFNKKIIWGGNYFADKLTINNDWLCWHKKNDKLSFSEFELAWSNLGKNCRLIQHHWGKEKKLHPTMKPIKVLEWCINMLDDNNIIFDLFLGSGSTMVAAHQLKRKCYGMELDPKYCQVIIDRMINLDDSLQVKINGKPYKK